MMNFEEFKARYEKKSVEEYPNQVDSAPLVSICVQTFQHVGFIRECLDGILAQQTDFPFEILLGEDGSNDGTRHACIDYARKYPKLIRLFLHHRENNIKIDGISTGRFNLMYNLFSARGKYISLCEGDDFWTSKVKLSKQVRFLEQNDNYSWCFHDARQLTEGTGQVANFSKVSIPSTLTMRDVMLQSGGFFHTASVVVVKKSFNEIPAFFPKIRAADWAMILIASHYGKGHFLRDAMSVYRIHNGGIFSSIKNNNRKRITALKSDLLLLDEFNIFTKRKHEKLIVRRKIQLYKKLAKRYLRHYLVES